MQVKIIAECSLGAFCNTFDLHYEIVRLEKTNNFLSFFEWPLKTDIQFDNLKKNTD